MEVRHAAKRQYFACNVNQSLLELAVKLREAEVRINGRTLQTAIPPRSIVPGISSTVDKCGFQFVARRNSVMVNLATSEYVNSSNAVVARDNSLTEVVSTDRFCASDAVSTIQEDVANVPINISPKKLCLPKRIGPSLWPFLSSVRASVDAENVRFLEKNRQYYSNYESSRITRHYTENLSDSDIEIVIDNAIDALLQTPESSVLQQSHSARPEPCVPVSVPVTVSPVSANITPVPLLLSTDMDVSSTFEADDISTTPTQPIVVSKRYAAAVANPRRFRCTLCPYSTNNRSHVRRHHLSVHSDARPYRCYVCGKEFARCENAKVHMTGRHPDVPYDVERLRNNMFSKPTGCLATDATKNDTVADSQSKITHSASMPAFQLHQDVASCGITRQWSGDSLAKGQENARFECQPAVPPWLNFPKIEPKVEPSLSVLGHGTVGNHLLEGIPHSMFQAQANTMLNVQPFLGPICPIKQEPNCLADTNAASYPVADRHVCLYCRLVCQNAGELANHIAINHSTFNPTLHATPSSNPGYVVLQTAAPIFLFPYGSDSLLPNRSQVGSGGYPPILPKLPVSSDDCKSQNEAVVGQQSSSTAAGTIYRSPQDVPNASTASASSLSASAPQREQDSRSLSKVPPVKRERKRQFKTFYCSHCPDRAPFHYEKSFEKHLLQHRLEERSQRTQKIASKVA